MVQNLKLCVWKQNVKLQNDMLQISFRDVWIWILDEEF